MPKKDIHFHCMKNLDYPKRFPNRVIGAISGTDAGLKFLDFTLQNVNPFSHNDMADKIISMSQAGRLGSQKAIYLNGRKCYPEDTKIVCLTMDMNYMGCGSTRRPYAEQLYELNELFQEDSRVLPFFHADPRNPDLYEQFNEYVVKRRWPGVKIYAPLGYFPNDDRLQPIYAYCEANNIPIIAHCTYGNPVHFKGSRKELKELLGDRYNRKLSKGQLCDLFTDPRNWLPVIKKYPHLRIDLAHAGGMEQWLKWLEDPTDNNNLLNIIIELIKEYPKNFYMDLSFTMANYKLVPVLQTLMNDPVYSFLWTNILYGSDYYLVISEENENVIYRLCRTGLGEVKFNQIASINNDKFLYG